MGGTAAQPAFRLALLGGFGLQVDGHTIDVADTAQRIIAYTALRSRPIRRDTLAGTLWPERPDDRARGNLRSALWRLRRQGVHLLAADGDTVGVPPDVEVDVHTVTCWAWRVIDGHPLPEDLERRPPPDDLLPDWSDDWVVVERERLRQLRLHAADGQCRALLAGGRLARAIDAALVDVSEDPLRESPHRVLIEALILEGSWSEAVRSGRRYAETMFEHLGLDVTDKLRLLLPAPLFSQVCDGRPRARCQPDPDRSPRPAWR